MMPSLLHQKMCRECEHPFLAGRRDAVYCSPKCRKRFSRRRQKLVATARDLLKQAEQIQNRLPDGDTTVLELLQGVTLAGVLSAPQSVTLAGVTDRSVLTATVTDSVVVEGAST